MFRRVAKDGDRTLSHDSVQESEPLATIADALSNLLCDSVCCSTEGVLLDLPDDLSPVIQRQTATAGGAGQRQSVDGVRVFGGDRLSRHPVAHQQTQRTPPLRIMPQGTDDSAGQLYNSRRPSIAFCIVTSSAYSMSLPTGTPVAMRVTFTLALLSSFDR
jgi:hypothetical protein